MDDFNPLPSFFSLTLSRPFLQANGNSSPWLWHLQPSEVYIRRLHRWHLRRCCCYCYQPLGSRLRKTGRIPAAASKCNPNNMLPCFFVCFLLSIFSPLSLSFTPSSQFRFTGTAEYNGFFLMFPKCTRSFSWHVFDVRVFAVWGFRVRGYITTVSNHCEQRLLKRYQPRFHAGGFLIFLRPPG